MSAAAPEAAPAERRNLLVPDAPRWPVDEARPVLALEGVSRAFDGKAVLRDLDLRITAGHTTVVMGESGSGKSVLLKLLCGLTRPDSGVVRLFGQDIARLSDVALTELRKRVAMVFQNYALFDSLTVFENIAFVLRENTRLPRAEVDDRVQELVHVFELGGAEQKRPAELSGGMRKRVSLARALIANPEVVLFDEPTTGLDPVMTERVDELIASVRDRFGITSVVISHDIASARRLADRIAVLHGGRIVAFGTPAEVGRTTDPRVRVFLDSTRTRRAAPAPANAPPAAPAPSGVARDGGPTAEPLPGPAADRPPVVELRGVHKRFGRQAVLRGVDLVVPEQRITVIIGGSGSGKSVIVKHIMGLLKADLGEVRVFGQDITRMPERALQEVRRRFGMLFQGAALLDSLTVEENVAFPLIERREARGREARRRVRETLERLHIPDIARQYPGNISAGQRKRVGLARAIVTRPEVMIYDEPTTGQDPIMTRHVDDMIVEAQTSFRITSIVISHDMASTFRIAHRIALLHQGVVAACGTPADLLAAEHPQVQEFIRAGGVEREHCGP